MRRKVEIRCCKLATMIWYPKGSPEPTTDKSDPQAQGPRHEAAAVQQQQQFQLPLVEHQSFYDNDQEQVSQCTSKETAQSPHPAVPYVNVGNA